MNDVLLNKKISIERCIRQKIGVKIGVGVQQLRFQQLRSSSYQQLKQFFDAVSPQAFIGPPPGLELLLVAWKIAA